MSRIATKKGLFTAIIVLAALLLIVGIVSVVRSLATADDEPADPYTSQSTNKDEAEVTEEAETTTVTPAVPAETPPSTLDPNTVSTIAIEPMSIEVSYVKGVGGFEFEVKRTPSGTQFVVFNSPELAGTKCTSDNGPFASIIENPAAAESAAISKRQTVGDKTYGLSLDSDACTSNPDLLKRYQASFSDAFSLLKAID